MGLGTRIFPLTGKRGQGWEKLIPVPVPVPIPARGIDLIPILVSIPVGDRDFSLIRGGALLGMGNPHPVAISTQRQVVESIIGN